MQKSEQMSDRFITGVILSIVGGFLDAYTYISRGHVFANAQTGNMVLFAVRCADREWKEAFYYLLPIAAFVLGILLAEIIKKRHQWNTTLHWRQIILLIEILVLAVVAFLPEGSYNTFANILVSFVCSLQVESFRTVNGKAYATTMCTGNLRSATEQLYHYKQSKDKAILRSSLQYYGIILFFILGAVMGTIATDLLGIKAVLFGCVGLIVVLGMLFMRSKAEII